MTPWSARPATPWGISPTGGGRWVTTATNSPTPYNSISCPRGTPYPLQKGRCHRLRADTVIAADQSAFAGAHSDIRHPEVTWPSWAAALG